MRSMWKNIPCFMHNKYMAFLRQWRWIYLRSRVRASKCPLGIIIISNDLEQLNLPPSLPCALRKSTNTSLLLGGDAWSLNGILSGEIRPLLSCATFPFKILLLTQTLNNYTDSCIILYQNDKAFALAPHFTLLMKNSKLLRPPSIKRELIQSNDRCMTMKTGFFF